MNNVQQALVDFLTVKSSAAAVRVNKTGFCWTRLFEMILSGDAKLPLDRVEEVSDLLDCDKRNLFRMAMRQFYDEESISTFERMLGNPLSEGEKQWLDIIRSASGKDVAAPSAMARRLIRAMAKPQDRV